MMNHFNKSNSQKKIVVAMDSFKGSLTSLEAGNAVRDGILEKYPDFDVQIFPVADGGEGTVEALTFGKEHVQTRTISVTGPIGTEVSAGYTIYEQAGEKTAVLEMAQVRSVTTENVLPELASCTFQIACDVTNPLVGAQGCSAVFAPQKGADAKMVQAMDVAMNRYADVVEDWYRKKQSVMAKQQAESFEQEIPDKNRMIPGVGAAGGLGYVCLMFLHAALKPGIDIVLEEIQIEQAIKTADAVITGEGRLDAQTLMGKTPIGVARIAKLYSVPVYAFAGCFGADVQACIDSGVFAGGYAASAASTEEAKRIAMEKTQAYANLKACVKAHFSIENL